MYFSDLDKKKAYLALGGLLLVLSLIFIGIFAWRAFNHKASPAAAPAKPTADQEAIDDQQNDMPWLNDENMFMDIDGDDLLGFDEVYIYHTDPDKPDTDGDGVNDGEAVRRGLIKFK